MKDGCIGIRAKELLITLEPKLIVLRKAIKILRK